MNFSPLPFLIAFVIALTIFSFIRILSLLPPVRRKLGWPAYRYESKEASSQRKCKVAVMLGSGGHTSELLQLLSALPPGRYGPRLYLVSEGDQFSADKALRYEKSIAPTLEKKEVPDLQSQEQVAYDILKIPRAREVHQPWISVPLSAITSFGECINIVFAGRREEEVQVGTGDASMSKGSGRGQRKPFADLLLMNGPGTCVPLVAAVYILRFFSLPSPRLMYVESFARVKSLSLTAKLLRLVVDRFIVQWPEAGRGEDEHKGWLV